MLEAVRTEPGKRQPSLRACTKGVERGWSRGPRQRRVQRPQPTSFGAVAPQIYTPVRSHSRPPRRLHFQRKLCLQVCGLKNPDCSILITLLASAFPFWDKLSVTTSLKCTWVRAG